MIKAKASVETENARKYLQQLCKHFAHKVPSEYDEKTGKVEFVVGECHMKAEDNALLMDCISNSEAEFKVLQEVLDNHLERFAWREKLKLSWTLEG